MSDCKKIRTYFCETGLKTIYFNFKYLPFRQAIRLPVLLSRKVYLKETAGKIIIEGPVKFGMIRIGYDGVGIFDYKYSRAIWQVSGTVVFKGRALIGHGSKISVGKEGKLVFGDNIIITAESAIIALKKVVEFGNDCLLAWDILIMDNDFHSILDGKGDAINDPANIKIGNHVWIGCRSLILKGSIIPDNSIIAAGSRVSKQLIGENKLFGGQPAEEKKANVSWKL